MLTIPSHLLTIAAGFAANKDKPGLDCVEVKKTGILVTIGSTDGHIMARILHEVPDQDCDFSVIIPAAVIPKKGTVVDIEPDKLTCHSKSGTTIVPFTPGDNFPNYEQLIPDEEAAVPGRICWGPELMLKISKAIAGKVPSLFSLRLSKSAANLFWGIIDDANNASIEILLMPKIVREYDPRLGPDPSAEYMPIRESRLFELQDKEQELTRLQGEVAMLKRQIAAVPVA